MTRRGASLQRRHSCAGAESPPIALRFGSPVLPKAPKCSFSPLRRVRKPSSNRKVVSVGAAGFEPTTSCTQISDGTVAGSSSGSQPSVIVRDRSRVTVQSSQPLADFRKRFDTPVLPGGRGKRSEQPTSPSLRLLQAARVSLLTAKEVAARLRVCTATAYKLCASGALPHVRVLNAVRVVEGDLERFVAARRRQPRRGSPR